MVDFVGAFVKEDGAQTGLTDAFIDSATGRLSVDPLPNVQTIAIELSHSTPTPNGTQLTAKFARPIRTKDNRHDLDISACTVRDNSRIFYAKFRFLICP